jgi:hypothetical protein
MDVRISLADQSDDTVTCIPTARQRIGKHIRPQAKLRNNRMSTARQRIIKHITLTIEAVFSAWSVQSIYKEVFGRCLGV